MLFSCWPVRLPGPDSSLKMLLKIFVVVMIRIWQSGQVMEFGDLPIDAVSTGGCYLVGSFTQSPLCLSLSHHEYQWTNRGRDLLGLCSSSLCLQFS